MTTSKRTTRAAWIADFKVKWGVDLRPPLAKGLIVVRRCHCGGTFGCGGWEVLEIKQPAKGAL